MNRNDDLVVRDRRAVRGIEGPLLFAQDLGPVAIGETAALLLPGGERRRGQVIEINGRIAVIQVLDETGGMGLDNVRIRLSGAIATMDLSLDLLGRRFNGAAAPVDGLPPIVPERREPILGRAINPTARQKPCAFLQTGISAIDGLNTLVRGQKLPVFSGAGLPAKEIAVQILRHARVAGEGADARFAVVFAAIGIPSREAIFFLDAFAESGVSDRTVAFLNLADDPAVERLLTPRYALTAAEHLAFDHGYHVLVILTDMTNYAEALREIATARREVPGRRGYPGYLYTDLATLYERAGCIRDRAGSVTQIPILTMPDDDLTHPVPDLTGYITEGQLVLSRELQRKGIDPPIDVLPSLSRLMSLGIGAGKTREDHREWADQLYALYAQGRDLRRLEKVVGAEGFGDADRRTLEFADRFEREFVHQGGVGRSIEETLEAGWRLMAAMPRERLTRLGTEAARRLSKGE